MPVTVLTWPMSGSEPAGWRVADALAGAGLADAVLNGTPRLYLNPCGAERDPGVSPVQGC